MHKLTMVLMLMRMLNAECWTVFVVTGAAGCEKRERERERERERGLLLLLLLLVVKGKENGKLRGKAHYDKGRPSLGSARIPSRPTTGR